MLLGIVLLQVGLGAAAWVTKFGFERTGYVAIADSIQQIGFRTAHTVVGIVVFMTAVVHAVRVLRVESFVRQGSPSLPVTYSSPFAATSGGAL
jgi:hypothetical protein